MSYMTCPRCGLSIRLRAPYLTLEGCPRCLARRRVSIQMDISEQPRGAEVEQGRPGERREKVPPGKEFGLRVKLKRGADSDV